MSGESHKKFKRPNSSSEILEDQIHSTYKRENKAKKSAKHKTQLNNWEERPNFAEKRTKKTMKMNDGTNSSGPSPLVLKMHNRTLHAIRSISLSRYFVLLGTGQNCGQQIDRSLGSYWLWPCFVPRNSLSQLGVFNP